MLELLKENEILIYILIAVLLVVVCFVASLIVRVLVKKLKVKDILADGKLTRKIHLLIPGILLYFAVPLLPNQHYLLEKIVSTYVLVMMTLVILELLEVLDEYYKTFTVSKTRPIKGFVQVGKILEIYAFATSTKWEVYERIQSDIFDHVMAIVGEFELALFQRRIL